MRRPVPARLPWWPAGRRPRPSRDEAIADYVRHLMQRLRVLWLIKGLGPGGAEQLLVAVAATRDRDFAVVDAAYLLPWKDALVPRLAETGVNVECLGVTNERDPRWALRLRRLMAERRHD